MTTSANPHDPSATAGAAGANGQAGSNGKPKPPPVPKIDKDLIRRFFCLLCDPAIGCMESRILDANMDRGLLVQDPKWQNTYSGYFDNPDSLAAEMGRLKGISAYATINPVDRSLLSLSDNRIIKAKSSTKDEDITSIVHWFIDIDPRRKSGISSTDAELAAAVARRDQILADHPEIAAASFWGISGNGAYIVARLVGYPNDEASNGLIAQAMEILSARYSDRDVCIDTATKNPARIMAIAGTVKCKGSDRPERPWRLATIDSPEDHDADRRPLDLADWIGRQPKPPEPETPRAAKPSRRKAATRAVDPYAAKALADELATLRATPNDRNIQLNLSAFNLGQLVGAGALNRSEVENALAAVAHEIGLTDQEIPKTIRSGLDAGSKEPRDLSHVGREQAERNGQAHHHENAAPRLVDIPVDFDEHITTAAAVRAISSDPTVYQRGNVLVTILRDPATSKGVTRLPGTPRIATLPNPRLRERLTIFGNWYKVVTDPKTGAEVNKPVHPPDWAISQVSARGEWRSVRPIAGIVEAPTLRPDGSLLDTPGWDSETHLLYEPNVEFPPIPAEPTPTDASKAAQSLLEIVADFPFAQTEDANGKDDGGAANRAVWLAAVLTPLARYAIDGPCPLFLFDANTPGTGKSKLCDIISILATGREMARADYPESEEEMAKMLLSVGLAADRMLLFDNVTAGFSIGGKSLDRTLTARTIKGRILGRSEMTSEMDMNTVFYATGNNLGLKGDALRRVCPGRLESPVERPEERKDFKIKGDLLAHVRRERPKLVAAALTILRGYIVAGRPPAEPELTPMDYPAWCGLIRSAVHWATRTDPCFTRQTLVVNDENTNALKALVLGWEALCQAENTDALTAAAALKALQATDNKTPDTIKALRELLCNWSKDGDLPSSRIVGNHLNKVKGRVSGGKTLTFSLKDGNRRWFVKPVRSSGSSDSSDSVPPGHARESSNQTPPTTAPPGANESHLNHLSHLPDAPKSRVWRAPENDLPDFGEPPDF